MKIGTIKVGLSEEERDRIKSLCEALGLHVLDLPRGTIEGAVWDEVDVIVDLEPLLQARAKE